ncbi:MAG: FMN-binding protein [Rhodoluna sp.]|nr:FMN-binding protein [Rhodoluna sp.]
MRIATKLATGLMGVGVLAVSYKLGLPTAASPLADGGTAVTSLTGDTVPGNQPTPSATPSPSASASASPSTSPKTPTPKKTKTPAAPSTGGTTTTTTSGGTKTGDSIAYRYGYIQVSVTEDTSGKITAIDFIQAGATGGRQQAFSILKTAALNAQGTSFGNVGGATYTTDAFKQALDSALAQF